jgi:hypothetical protein
MQCGLHHRITANGHGRMCPASPITILFMTCEPERITAAKAPCRDRCGGDARAGC